MARETVTAIGPNLGHMPSLRPEEGLGLVISSRFTWLEESPKRNNITLGIKKKNCECLP